MPLLLELSRYSPPQSPPLSGKLLLCVYSLCHPTSSQALVPLSSLVSTNNLPLLDLLSRQPLELEELVQPLELEELVQPLELVNSHPTSRLLLDPANNLLELTSNHPSLQLPLPMSAPASSSAKL